MSYRLRFKRILLPTTVAALVASACTTGAWPQTDDEEQLEALSKLVDRNASVHSIFFRTIDGTFNNLLEPELGSAGRPLVRTMLADYADGLESPAGADRPSARLVSNVAAAQSGSIANAQGASDYLWAWGQFLDHDVDLTGEADPAEAFDIAVPAGDPHFDPDGTGTQTIPMNRSVFEHDASGVRHQLNQITAYIDGSNVYGSDRERALALRALDGTGRLRVSDGDLLPFNTEGFPNAAPPDSDPSDFFLAGDVRANEVTSLLALHNLFVREHNRFAEGLRAAFPWAGGNAIYHVARTLVGAEIQAITYNEFLPVLLGDAVPEYEGYNPWRSPEIANEFSTVAYRVGHTMLSTHILRRDADGAPIAQGPLPLQDAFFAPQRLIETGLGPVLRGLSAQPSQAIDVHVVDDVRNFLFGPPGAGGFDLASLNIQRGRDHGLPGYNAAREALGLDPANTFAEISSDPETAARLAEAYESPDDVDMWIGGLAEDHVPGAMVGELFAGILAEQFTALRAGDRFWYEFWLPPPIVDFVESRTLADIIRDNTDVGTEIPDNVFLVEE